MKNYSALDHSQVVNTNMFKAFAIRNKEAMERVGLLKWIWLCVVEIMFGEELIESIVTTASVENTSDRYKSKRKKSKRKTSIIKMVDFQG